MAVSFDVGGSFSKTVSSLTKMSKVKVQEVMDSCGAQGVSALSRATPVDSGLARESWGYETQSQEGSYTIAWTNQDVEHGFPVVIMLQYGYATGTGGYVQGRDYINPAISPIFDQIANDLWKAVTSA